MEIFMLNNMIKSVMDPDTNGLSKLPKVVRFQIMVALSFMWSIIFCISAGVFVWLPGYMAVHVILLLVGIFGTAWMFKSSQASPDGK
jgi:hypothetical protein